ncbi:MAG: hypothetical protein HGA96_11100 [Desulfobulbaceae bacterium]|nr:hypothetical protein [Desulfobulbaceae bacterium]
MGRDQLIKILLLAGLVLLLTAITRKDQLPAVTEIDHSLYREPVQKPVQLPVFQREVEANTYLIQPLYSYDLSGLVVSFHDSDVWWDIYHHDSWLDFINVKDLCVVWGQNLQSDVYRQLTYDSNNWTCYYLTPDQASAARFRPDQLSNNHLLSADSEIKKMIMGVGLGDQIHLQGHLVNYANPANKFRRGTSTTRADTGNGACETIYVEAFEIIQANHPGWHAAYLLAKIMIAAALFLWVLNFLFGDVASFTKE